MKFLYCSVIFHFSKEKKLRVMNYLKIFQRRKNGKEQVLQWGFFL
jgi:hypothetical protein